MAGVEAVVGALPDNWRARLVGLARAALDGVHAHGLVTVVAHPRNARPRMPSKPCCTRSASRSSLGGKGQDHTPLHVDGSAPSNMGE